MPIPKSWKTVEIMTQCKYLSEEHIQKGLDHRSVKDYAYICHDKDIDIDGTPKKPHWHIMIRFNNAVLTESICDWFNVKSNFLEHIKGRFADALAYLTHSNSPDKHQYDNTEVKTNFDFVKEIEKNQSQKIDEKRKEDIITGIVNGDIREYNYTEYINPYEYVKLKKVIDDSFKYRKDCLMMNKNRNIDCFYFCGDSGTGKTTFAKYFCEKKNLSYFVSSGSNDPLDGYRGEDVLILDDIRGENHNVSDVLKMLDNNTSSSVRSRYSNKFLECNFIIITSVQHPTVFFGNCLSFNNETIIQLKRRCQVLAMFEDYTINWFVYDDVTKDYVFEKSSDNIVSYKFLNENKQKKLSYFDDVISFEQDLF